MGVEPKRVNYIAFSGGGESMSAILGGTVSVGINGFAEFAPQLEAGTLRALAISSAERLPGVDIPTLREQGVDVEFENWRSLVAPPGISAGRPRAARGGRSRDGAVAGVARVARALSLARSLSRWRRLRAVRGRGGSARAGDPEEARDRGDRDELGRSVGRRIRGWCSVGLLLFGLAALRSRLASTEGPPSEPVIHRRGARRSCVGTGVVLHLLLAERAGFVHRGGRAVLVHGARLRSIVIPCATASRRVAISLGVVPPVRPVLQLSLPAGILAAGSDTTAH